MPSPELTNLDAELRLGELPATEDQSSVATLEEPADPKKSTGVTTEVQASDAPACEKCQTTLSGKQGWCRRCGWYPRLGTFVELDPWDREDLPQPKPKTKLEVCKALIPKWGWMLIAGSVAILTASFVLRQILPPGNVRFYWTIGQMGLGELTFWGAHLASFLFATMHNDRIQLLDILLKPLAIWGAVIRELPSTFWQVAFGLWGTTAVLGGLIVGGLADRDLLDWGGTPARYNLTKAIADRAQELAANAESDKSLEESIEDFAGKAAEKVDDQPEKGKPKLPVDCLIVGYKPLGDKDFSSLILAAEVGGKLKIVGTVSDGITPEMRAHLNRRMRDLRQPNPFIPNRYDGKWIQPGLVCKVKAKQWSNDNRLIEPVFEEMLVDVDPQQR